MLLASPAAPTVPIFEHVHHDVGGAAPVGLGAAAEVHARGQIALDAPAPEPPPASPRALCERLARRWRGDAEALARRRRPVAVLHAFRRVGVHYGATYRRIGALWGSASEAVALIEPGPEAPAGGLGGWTGLGAGSQPRKTRGRAGPSTSPPRPRLRPRLRSMTSRERWASPTAIVLELLKVAPGTIDPPFARPFATTPFA